MHKAVFPLWLSNCPAVICSDACVCVCVWVLVCSGVFWCADVLGVDVLPVTRAFGEQSGGVDSQTGDWQGREVQSTGSQGLSRNVCVTQEVLTVCYIHISKLNMCMFFVTHTQFVYARSKPDLG